MRHSGDADRHGGFIARLDARPQRRNRLSETAALTPPVPADRPAWIRTGDQRILVLTARLQLAAATDKTPACLSPRFLTVDRLGRKNPGFPLRACTESHPLRERANGCIP